MATPAAPVPTPPKVKLPWKLLVLEPVVAEAFEPVEDSLTVMVIMSPIFDALRSAQSEPLFGAHREPVGTREAGGGPASGKGRGLELEICFGGEKEAAVLFFDCAAQPVRTMNIMTAENR